MAGGVSVYLPINRSQKDDNNGKQEIPVDFKGN
jgi:hypothetical protein